MTTHTIGVMPLHQIQIANKWLPLNTTDNRDTHQWLQNGVE